MPPIVRQKIGTPDLGCPWAARLVLDNCRLAAAGMRKNGASVGVGVSPKRRLYRCNPLVDLACRARSIDMRFMLSDDPEVWVPMVCPASRSLRNAFRR